jgi:D-alanyl-D-alanine carboxypeptidase
MVSPKLQIKRWLGYGLAGLLAAGGLGVYHAHNFDPVLKLGFGAAAIATSARLGFLSQTAATITRLPRGDEAARALNWESAATGQVGPDRLFRTASTSKTYVAAAILRLMESGRLRLEDPIALRLSPDLNRMLVTDGYDTATISIAMLLNHTSGIADFFSMQSRAGQAGWLDGLVAEPARVWTRAEQVKLTVDLLAPVAAPGQSYAYSDTGYILLGDIIEQTTGKPLGQSLRELLGFQRLGLTGTSWEIEEPLPAGDLAEQRFSGIDAWTIHGSADAWGAGGIITTPRDLNRFFAALGSGEVFEKPETLALMLKPSPQSLAHGGDGYGLGVSLASIRGYRCFGHGGFWGVLALTCPEAGITVAGMVTDASGQSALKDQLGAMAWMTLPQK